MKNAKRQFLATLTLATAVLASSCGQQAFIAKSSAEQLAAPGVFTIPAKVDILLAQDDTGSMYEAYNGLQSQLPSFLNGIEAQGWDYHFATVPLTRQRSVTQIVASKYDGSNPNWVAPFPGAIQTPDLGANLFRFPSNYTGFISPSDINNYLSGYEPGLDNITRNLETLNGASDTTGFLRDDAMLVVVVVGNGDDTSGINYCNRGDGIMIPCNDGSADSSYATYKSRLLALKPNAAQIKFFAAVSPKAYNGANNAYANCLGGYAYAGTRYEKMAGDLNGASFDVCSQSISGVLGSLSSSLTSFRIGLETRYLFIQNDADESTITVTKYVGGTTPVAIPQDATNGWTYVGANPGVYAIDYPINMNYTTGGYVIELHGSAKLVGYDTATVQYTQKGLQSSSH